MPFSLFQRIHQYLFPLLEEKINPLTDKEADFVWLAECAAIDRHLGQYSWIGNGRKPKDRKALALAFLAKALWNWPTTATLIEQLKTRPNLRLLCGWIDESDIPSEATFSRAFEEFSKGCLAEAVHEAIVRSVYREKLVGHISRDSTAIEAREKSAKKVKEEPKPKKKRGRRKKGEPPPKPEFKLIELQVRRSLEENLKGLPTKCNTGTKKNSKGYKKSWVGYKLHMDVADGDIPISAILTSASLHDSQVAIPLIQMSTDRVAYFYDLADAAYDAELIWGYSRIKGHVPIIDINRRRGEAIEIDPAYKERYKQRGSVERAYSNLKDNFGGRFIRVKGALKVMAHLMFGVVAMTAMQLLQMVKAKERGGKLAIA